MSAMNKQVGRSARAPLTLDAIVDAALMVIDEQGLERLSMRRLGARLGVEAMTLYHHVPSKDALLDRLVERVIARAGFLEADPAMGWRERLERFARRYRAILVDRPNLAPLIATRPVRSPDALRELAAGGAVLMREGFTLEQCFYIGNTIAMLVIGAVLAQVGPSSGAPVSADDSSAFATAMSDPDAAVHDHDAIFDFALGCLLDGVASREKHVDFPSMG
jgi:TetR/AcrR family transcriptional regulator, tetracycline repressor protein